MRSRNSAAFTLIELIVVITVIAIAGAILAIRTGSVDYWKQEAFLRKLVNTIEFLHYQSVQDGEHYTLEFSFKEHAYRVGVLKSEEDLLSNTNTTTSIDPDAGALSYELAAVLNPVLGKSYTLIPPPSYPSLAEPVELPEDVYLKDVRTQRGLKTPATSEKVSILFSPRGFSEFAVIHLRLHGDAPFTILVNPFTGLTESFDDDRDFEWSYGRQKNS